MTVNEYIKELRLPGLPIASRLHLRWLPRWVTCHALYFILNKIFMMPISRENAAG